MKTTIVQDTKNNPRLLLYIFNSLTLFGGKGGGDEIVRMWACVRKPYPQVLFNIIL